MQHELNALQLKSAPSDMAFLRDYLGPQLLPKIDKLFKLSSMPADVLGVYRAIAELMADLLPEADHVVRDDVASNANALPAEIGGYLALYIGVQTPAFDTRHQFIGLAFRHDRPEQPWVLYIAGAQDNDNLQSLVNESTATRALNGLSLRCTDDIEALKPSLEAVARHYQGTIAARKSGVDGFIPATAWERQQYINRHLKGKKIEERLQEAREIAYRHFTDWSASLAPAEKMALKAQFKTREGAARWEKFVQMIFSGYAPEVGFETIRAPMAKAA